MYPLGHVAFTLAAAKLLRLSPGFAVLGVLLPDLIDKPLFFLLDYGPGRYFAHNLSFAVLAASVLARYLGTRAGISLGMGVVAHLVEDSHAFVPWLFPLINYTFPDTSDYRIAEHYFSSFFGVGTDLLGAMLLGAIYRHRFALLRRRLMHAPEGQ